LSLTRNQAVDQCQKMTNLVDQVIYKAKQKWKLIMLSVGYCKEFPSVEGLTVRDFAIGRSKVISHLTF
jgi:hypothetical protein